MLRPERRLALAALAAVTLSACAGAQQTAPAQRLTSRDYFPLRQGAAWSFDANDVDRPGVATLVTMRVVRDDGANGYYVQQHGSRAPAIYEYLRNGVTRNGEVFLRDPIEPDARWQNESGDTYVIRQVGLSRTVPAGTFQNVIEVVRSAGAGALQDGTEYRETYYYAPNVGVIEAVVPLVLDNEVRRYRLVLRGYTLDGEF